LDNATAIAAAPKQRMLLPHADHSFTGQLDPPHPALPVD